jgi:hypothetical protein
MPNWCYNSASITCPSKDIYDKLLLSMKHNTWFQTFAMLDDNESIQINEIWNTKGIPRNIEIIENDNDTFTIEVSFETAWSPPIGVYKIMKDKHKIYTTAYYEELGCEFFGRCFFSEEDDVDDIYELPSDLEELEELRKIIGPDLDDYMSSTWEELQEQWELYD